MDIYINFKNTHTHLDIVKQLSPVFKLQKGESVNFSIDINTNNILYPDLLLIVVTTIKYLKESEVDVKGNIINFDPESPQAKYASRIDFFKEIGVKFKEEFKRHPSTGKFIEITYFDDDNVVLIHKKIMNILINSKNINQDMLMVLDYCLYEVLDNTLTHSVRSLNYGMGKGYVCCQHFPYMEKIRIIIADTGIGIHEALTFHPNSEYKHYSEEKAVRMCIEKDITNSKGKGFGLWATTELIKQNKGVLSIHSGKHQLICNNHHIQINKTCNWKGTYTFLEINTNTPVEYSDFFDNNIQKNRYNELKEDLTENLDELW